MYLFEQYKLKQDKNGYTVILYLNSNLFFTEFADEFGHIKNEKTAQLHESVKKYIKEKFPNIKVNAAKLMIGSMLLASIPLGSTQAIAYANPAYEKNVNYTQGINIILDGKAQKYNQEPIIINNTTYVPVRGIAESIGARVWWNGDSKTVGINKEDTKISFVVGSNIARVNGKMISMPPSFIINSTTMIPLRFVSEILGLNVKWDQSSRSAILTTETLLKPNLEDTATRTEYEYYTVQPGDSLWLISRKFNTTIDNIKKINNLKGDTINIGQKLKINTTQTRTTHTPQSFSDWSEVTYIVQPGDSLSVVARKFGVSAQDILKYNYMEPNEWLDAGERIAISGYAPRDYAVRTGEVTAPLRVGKLVDWYRDGQYILKRGDVFTITDVNTGKRFRVKMMGGYNHSDIEPLTPTDTKIMRDLFETWKWKPRAVVIFKDGMNIAGSLSGMPHSFEIIKDNGVLGHFDLYLLNSKPHRISVSATYVQQHRNMVYKASGR